MKGPSNSAKKAESANTKVCTKTIINNVLSQSLKDQRKNVVSEALKKPLSKSNQPT